MDYYPKDLEVKRLPLNKDGYVLKILRILTFHLC